jgi:hypothetical protein
MNQRLMVYRRLASVRDVDEVDAIMAELHDRYGTPPPSVLNLAEFARIRLAADRLGMESLDREGTVLVMRFRQDARIDPAALARLLQQRGDLTLVPPVVLKMDLAKSVAPPAPILRKTPSPEPRPAQSRRMVTAHGQTARIVRPSNSGAPRGGERGSPEEAPDASWWTARATSSVTAGFTRQEMLAETPPDPAAPGGLFERLGEVLAQLSAPTLQG